MNTWRVALRVARRSVRLHLGRSLLIIALIALPVAGLTVVDGLVHTMTDRDVEIDRAMGTADARITYDDRRRGRIEIPFENGKISPPGSRAVPLGAPNVTGTLRLDAGDRVVRSRLDTVVLGDPLTAHLARLESGRLPKTADEALVTEPLAEQLGLLDDNGNLRPGATLRASGGPPVTVTGLAVKPYCLRCTDVVARPGSSLEKDVLGGSPIPLGFLLDLPDGVDVADLAERWRADVTITTRDSYRDTTPFGGYLRDAAGEPVTLFAGLGLLGIVVTAAAAFAVGARRQVRELGVVAVNGGTAKHVRRIVLAQGVVLGVFGAATGLVAGAAVTVLGVPLWERLTGRLMEDLRFGWLDLAVVALVGVLASVAAATGPAFSVARMRPVDALAGRFRAEAPKTRPPLLGLLLVLAGAAAVVVAAVLARRRVAEHRALLAQYNYAPPLDQTLPVTVTLAGAVVMVLGMVFVLPALTAAVGRLGRRLPLSGRLAVRDALRHRQRTVAAGTAVMVTVAGSVVAAFVFAARADSAPKTLPDNTAIAQLDVVGLHHAAANGARQLQEATTTMVEAVPGAVTQEIRFVDGDLDSTSPSWVLLASGPGAPCRGAGTRLGIATPELIELSTGRRPDVGVRTALAEGKVVVFDECLMNRNGTVVVSYNLPTPATVVAYSAPPAPETEGYREHLPTAFIAPEVAAARGWEPYVDGVVVTYPDPDDLTAIRAAAANAGVDLTVGESAGVETTSLYLVLAGVAALVALLGAGVTVALSATDGRADLATLAALGAPPRRRRSLAAAHALVVTALGTLAGLALGVCTSQAAVPVAGMLVFSVPWQQIWLTLLAVPLLASVAAALATPSRLPAIGRQEP